MARSINPASVRLRLVGLIACCLVSGCGRDQSLVTITLWHQMVAAERAVLEEEIARFEAAHPGVQVNTLYKETEELRSGFQAAVLAGAGPDLLYGPSDPIGPYQKMRLVQDLTPWFPPELQQEFRDDALTRLTALDDPSRTELLHVGDRVGNHLALVYNQKLIPNPPQTTSEWVRLATENTRDLDGDGITDQYGLVWNFIEPYFAIPFLTGYGAWIFEEGTTRPSLNTPQMVSALQFVISLQQQYHVLPAGCDYDMADSLFKNGQAAMLINGDWSWGEYLRLEKIDAAVAPLPIVDETGLPMAPMVDSKGYALSALVTGEQADWAMRLVRFLTSSECQRRFLLKLRTLPSRSALYGEPILWEDPMLRASREQFDRGRRMPVVSEMRAVWDGMKPHYQALLGGAETAAEAAAGMQRTTERRIARMNVDQRDVRRGSLILSLSLLLLGVAVCYWQRHALVQLPSDLRRQPMAYIFILPTLAALAFTIVYPFGFNVALSFSNMTLNRFQDWTITGWQNYLDVFSLEFFEVLAKTIVWTVVNVFFHVTLGVLLAVTLHGPLLAKPVYRVLLIIPWAVPSYVTALTWRGMFDWHYGAINRMAIQWFGLQPVNWLGEETTAFIACIVTNIWLGVPFMMVITLGGLQGIPPSLYEAARIDRASRWTQFWHITLPMLMPVLIPAVTLGAIWTFNNLNVVWLVSNGGYPSDKTHILVSYVYRAVFNLYQYGYGAALSMVIFLILLASSVLFLNRVRATES